MSDMCPFWWITLFNKKKKKRAAFNSKLLIFIHLMDYVNRMWEQNFDQKKKKNPLTGSNKENN